MLVFARECLEVCGCGCDWVCDSVVLVSSMGVGVCGQGCSLFAWGTAI